MAIIHSIIIILCGAALNGLACYLFARWLTAKIKPKPLQELLIREIEEYDFEKDLHPLIEQRLGRFIENLKVRIPMAAAVLRGAVAETIKEQAREDLNGMIPELRNLLVYGLLNKTLEEKLKKQIRARLFRMELGFGIFGVITGVIIMIVALII